MRERSKTLLLVLFFFCVPFLSAHAEEYRPYRVVLHVHSNVSGEESTLEEIARVAQKRSIDAVIMTDYFQQKVSWGILSTQKPSVLKKGVDRYFDLLDESSRKVQSVQLIPGVEVTPFYWWSGSLWDQNWTVHDLQKNLLVVGLDAEALKKIPTIENKAKKWKKAPQKRQEKPYQELIHYVNKQNGISIWSTPDEAFGAEFKIGPVAFSTPPYTEALKRTRDYTGIAIYPEGYLETGKPGGVWDSLLNLYCRGKRSSPPWAFAEGVIHDEELYRYLSRWDNVVLAQTNKKEAFVKAMKKGRFYIRKVSEGDIRLDLFKVTDTASSRSAIMGEELEIRGQARLSLLATLSEKELPRRLILDIIRNGKVVHTVESETGRLAADWLDPQTVEVGRKSYYRLEARTRPQASGLFMSNPIFVLKE